MELLLPTIDRPSKEFEKKQNVLLQHSVPLTTLGHSRKALHGRVRVPKHPRLSALNINFPTFPYAKNALSQYHYDSNELEKKVEFLCVAAIYVHCCENCAELTGDRIK